VRLGDEVKRRLQDAATRSRIIDEVRGRGFFIGIELVADKATRQPLDAKDVGRIAARCEQRGVRIMACGRYGSAIRLMPPLIITKEHFNKAVDVFVDVVGEIEHEVL
jgi:4-aminobutyrate aminotransferase-like enzyme